MGVHLTTGDSRRARAVVQFYNRANAGDDLLVHLLARRFQSIDLLVDLSEQVSSLQSLHNVIEMTGPAERHRPFGRLYTSVLGGLGRPNNAHLIEAAQKAIALIHIGGSIFIEHPNSRTHWRRERRYYRALPSPYFIVDANFGPYFSHDYPGLVREILAGAADVCVRDKETFDLFSDLPNIRLAHDVAFSTPKPLVEPHASPTVVISVMDVSRHSNSWRSYDQEVAKLIRRSVRDGFHVKLISFCRFQGDESASVRIAQLTQLSTSERELVSFCFYRGNLNNLLSEIARAELVVGTRFHATVLGLAFGVPTIPLVYSEKTSAMLSSLGLDIFAQDVRADTAPISLADAVVLSPAERNTLSTGAQAQFHGIEKYLSACGAR